MAKKATTNLTQFPALKVNQWLDEWDNVPFDAGRWQAKPQPHFYLTSIPATTLKALTGVYRRSVKEGQPRAKDPNVQRGHEEGRSQTIQQFVKYGFPWCDMSAANRNDPDAMTLRKPGWLPTAIIVNILRAGDARDNGPIGKQDLVQVNDANSIPTLVLPQSFDGPDWEPDTIYPLEVIDGQHRLWAFEDFDAGPSFDLPVVAFHGLDRSWQAYLFWSVNITPKKINRSLAFDLHPLLRREDWLDKTRGHQIYRETRSQELVESLWSHPESPWHHRINMLGETAGELGTTDPMVSQAAWVRTLTQTFVKSWADDSPRIGGLFGAGRDDDELVLPWSRAMQLAFLIFAGTEIRQAVRNSKHEWATYLRRLDDDSRSTKVDAAFYGKYSLLMTDQGIRGLFYVINDMCVVSHEKLKLKDWTWESFGASKRAAKAPATDQDSVDLALESLKREPVAKFLRSVAEALAACDWRTSATPMLPPDTRLAQAVFRGSSGYKEMRLRLLTHLSTVKGTVGTAAQSVMSILGYK